MLAMVLISSLMFQVPTRSGPGMFFDEESFSAGTVKQFTVVNHTFSFVNNGDKTLIINKVETGCGCTKASASATEIPPNGKGTITMSYTTDLESGEKVKPAYVHTNIEGEAPRRLELSAVVVPAIACEPTLLDFGTLESGATKTLTAKLKGFALGEVKITEVLNENPHLEAKLIDGGKTLSVTVLPTLKVGKVNERIRFQTESEQFKIVPAVTVSAKIQGALEAKPQLVDFDAFDNGQTSVQTREVMVQTRGKKPFKILGVDIKKAPIQAEVIEVEKGKVYKIVLTCSTDFRNAKALIRTDDPAQPELQITLFGKRK